MEILMFRASAAMAKRAKSLSETAPLLRISWIDARSKLAFRKRTKTERIKWKSMSRMISSASMLVISKGSTSETGGDHGRESEPSALPERPRD